MAQTKYKTDCPKCGGKGITIPKSDFRGAKNLPDYKNAKDCHLCLGSGDKPKNYKDCSIEGRDFIPIYEP